jgi:O-acetyl-ADP-ribose deacetylase (regulator of RNase III)
MSFTIVRQDITTMEVDTIVNAANPALKMGGGVCGAIFQAAGVVEMQAACEQLAPIQTGDAVITPDLDCRPDLWCTRWARSTVVVSAVRQSNCVFAT